MLTETYNLALIPILAHKSWPFICQQKAGHKVIGVLTNGKLSIANQHFVPSQEVLVNGV